MQKSVIFKGKLIHPNAYIRSRQMNAWITLLGAIFIGIGVNTAFFWIILGVLILIQIIYFLASKKILSKNGVIGQLIISEKTIIIENHIQNLTKEIDIEMISHIKWYHTETVEGDKISDYFKEILGRSSHPSLEFTYLQKRHEIYFTIDSHYMHEQIKALQHQLDSNTGSFTKSAKTYNLKF
jgi:hypothetical protein